MADVAVICCLGQFEEGTRKKKEVFDSLHALHCFVKRMIQRHIMALTMGLRAKTGDKLQRMMSRNTGAR